MKYYNYNKQLPTCPRCEIRPIAMRYDGHPFLACRECRNAELSLARYWRIRGTPLWWVGKPHRRWLAPLPPLITPNSAA